MPAATPFGIDLDGSMSQVEAIAETAVSNTVKPEYVWRVAGRRYISVSARYYQETGSKTLTATVYTSPDGVNFLPFASNTMTVASAGSAASTYNSAAFALPPCRYAKVVMSQNDGTSGGLCQVWIGAATS